MTDFSSEQYSVLQDSLARIADQRVFPFILETVLFSQLSVLVFTSSWVLVKKGLDSRPNVIMLVVILLMFALSAICWAVDLAGIWLYIKRFVLLDVSGDLEQLLKLVNTFKWMGQLSSNANTLCTFTSDSVVAWRACAIWEYNRRIITTAFILLLGLFVASVISALSAAGFTYTNVHSLQSLASQETVWVEIWFGFSAAVNVFATCAIAYKIWARRRSLQDIAKAGRRSGVERILAMLVDTGIVYTVLWVANACSVIPGETSSVYSAYTWAVMSQLTGMYPTIIIIVVALNKSYLEQSSPDSLPTSSGTVVSEFHAHIPHRSTIIPQLSVGSTENSDPSEEQSDGSKRNSKA